MRLLSTLRYCFVSCALYTTVFESVFIPRVTKNVRCVVEFRHNVERRKINDCIGDLIHLTNADQYHYRLREKFGRKQVEQRE